MALNNRVVQNIDLQGDATALQKALQSIGVEINKIVKSSGTLNANLERGAKAGSVEFNKQLKILQQLVSQATALQNIVDGVGAKKTGKAQGLLDEQGLGRKTAAASRLKTELASTDSVVAALDKRMVLLNQRFAELGRQGRSVSKADLSKQLRVEEARKQVQQLQGALTRLDGRSLNTPSRGASVDMQRLRTEIEKVNSELLKSAQNSRRSTFQPKINELRALVDQYQKLIALEIREANISSGRKVRANNVAQDILAQTDSQRLAVIKKASSGYQFPAGISNSVSLRDAENQLADGLRRRLAIIELINKAQDRGASTRAVERLNQAYTNVNQKLGEQFKLVTSVNKELMQTPGTTQYKSKFSQTRSAINEQLFGDGGLAFASRIAGASVITTGVFAVINAIQAATATVIEYEAALKQLEAISGSTGGQMRQLSEGILQVAQDSKYSVIEITKAATVIAQAGFSSKETNTLLGGVVSLSSGAGVDPSQASDVLTSAIGAFNLEASQTPQIVETLITGLNRTKLSVEQVRLAIQYAGATAKESGATFDELIAVAATAANAGIRSGSTIGTGYRQLVVDLQTPTKEFKRSLQDLGLTMEDVNVRSLGFAKVVKNLTDAGFSAEQAYGSFETRAASFFLSFRNQIDTYDELALALTQSGAAAKAQEAAMDSLSAQWQRFKNILTEYSTGIGSAVTDTLKVLLKIVNEVLIGIMEFAKGIISFTDSLGFTREQITVVGAALIGSLFGPIGVVIGALTGLLAALGSTRGELSELEDQLAETNAVYDEQMQRISSLDDAISRLIERQGSLTDGSTELQIETINLSNQFEGLGVSLDAAKVGYNELLTAMMNYGVEARKTALATAQLAAAEGNSLLEEQLKQVNGKELPPYVKRAGIRYVDEKSQSNIRAVEKILSIPVTQSNASIVNNGAKSVLAQLIKDKAQPSLIKFLQDHLVELSALSKTVSEVSLAEARQRGLEATLTNQYLEGSQEVVETRRKVEQVLGKAKDGDTTGAAAVAKAIEQEISDLEEKRSSFKEASAEYRSYTLLINQWKAEKSKLTSQIRSASEALDKEAAANLKKQKTIRSGTPKRDIDELAMLAKAQGYSVSYGLNRKDSKKHSSGLAVDINIPGGGKEAANKRYKAEFDKRALEYQKLGYNVIWNKKVYWADGRITSIPPEWKTNDHSNHMHVNAPEGGISVSSGGMVDSAGSQANDILIKQEDALKKTKLAQSTSTAEKNIQSILSQAKAGIIDPEKAKIALGVAADNYRAARLNQFDGGYQLSTLSGPALEDYKLTRQSLIDEITAKATTDLANLSRAIGDAAEKVYDLTISVLEKNLAIAEYNAEAVVRQAQANIDKANTPLNRGRNADEGTQYYLNKQLAAAQLNSDRAKVSLQDGANAQSSIALSEFKNKIDMMPEGEAKVEAVTKYNEAFQKLNESLSKTEELQASINSRTQEYIALPLNDRIREGVAAWAEQSGVMNTWQDNIANNIVPALELVTDQFANMFTQLATGQTTIKKALAGMIQAIGQFIVQLIAKALALMAIKWFLKMIGVELVDGPGGVSLQKITPQMTGGPAGEPMKLMDGGYISQGVRNRDSVPALLANNEYVVRGASVDSIGKPIMDDINRYGAKAIERMSGSTVIAPQSKQEVNVYVVKPDERPQLTKNDIVLAISDDMLQGGQTKQLVRQISQGG